MVDDISKMTIGERITAIEGNYTAKYYAAGGVFRDICETDELKAIVRQRDALLQAVRLLIECEEVIDGASRSTKSAVYFKHLADIVEEVEKSLPNHQI